MRCLAAVLVVLMVVSSVSRAADPRSVAQHVVESGVLRCGYATSPPVLVKDANTGAFQLHDMIDVALRALVNNGTVARLLAETSKDLVLTKRDYWLDRLY